MKPIARRSQRSTARPTDVPTRSRVNRVETIATIASLIVIGLVTAVDLVREAPPDAPVAQATFDVAPPVGWMPLQAQAGDRWYADTSAQGARPDAAR